MAIKDDIACYPYPTNGMYLQVMHQILLGKPTYLVLHERKVEQHGFMRGMRQRRMLFLYQG